MKMVNPFLPEHIAETLIFEAKQLARDKTPWKRYCEFAKKLLEYFYDQQKLTPKKPKRARDGIKKSIRSSQHKRISIIDMTAVDPSFRKTAEIPPLFFVYGCNLEILKQPFATVFNSRKPRLLDPDDFWLRGTVFLADKLAKEGFSLVSSTGTAGYDILSFKAWKANHPLVVVLDHALPPMLPNSEYNKFSDRYGWLLDNNRTILITPFPSNSMMERKKRMILRDKIIAMLSNTIAIAAIRNRGNMVNFAQEATETGKNVLVLRPEKFDHQTKGNQKILQTSSEKAKVIESREFYTGRSTSRATTRSIKKTIEKSGKIVKTFPSGYLIHFTRQCPGPWSGQSYSEYLESLVENHPDAYHTAFETLRRILRDGRIRASSKMYRGNIPVVSFTECLPEEIIEITKWNPALIRWTFEPYGIAFPKKALMELGAKPVLYGKNSDYKELPRNKRYLFQLHDPPDKSWKQEKEWRIKDDLLIDKFDPTELVVVVKHREEAEEIIREFFMKTYIVRR